MTAFNRIASLFLVCTLVAGCSWKSALTTVGILGAAGAGAAAVYYTQGDLEADHDSSVKETYAASKTALESKGYEVTEEEPGTSKARLAANDPATGKKVTVNLKERNGGTHIAIRYGTIGDEAKSRELYDAIRDNLK